MCHGLIRKIHIKVEIVCLVLRLVQELFGDSLTFITGILFPILQIPSLSQIFYLSGFVSCPFHVEGKSSNRMHI